MERVSQESIIVLGDLHFPFHDAHALELVSHIIADTRPTRLISIGDMADFYAVSRYPKGRSRKLDLAWEIDEATRYAQQLIDLSPGTKCHVTLGNHDIRLDKYLAENPVLDNVEYLQWSKTLERMGWHVTHYGESLRIGRILFSHDFGRSGASAFVKAVHDVGSSCVFGHCLPVDYEVLTERGWIRIDEVTLKDTAFSYSNGKVVRGPVRDTVGWDVEDTLIRCDSPAMPALMTSKHHIYFADGRYIPVTDTRSEKESELVWDAEPEDCKGVRISDNVLRLLVATAADGSYDRGNDASSHGYIRVRFHLKKQRKIDRLDSLVPLLKWGKVSKTGSRKVSLDAVLSNYIAFVLGPDKRLPWSLLMRLSPRQAQLVIDELLLWDGTQVTDNVAQFCSHNRSDIDTVQMLCTKAGYRSRLHKDGTVLSWHTKKRHWPSNRRNLPIQETLKREEYKGRVGCITTDYNNFWCRTPDGKVFLSGNTHRAGIHYQPQLDGSYHAAMNVGWLGNRDWLDYGHADRAHRDSALGFGSVTMDDNGDFLMQFHPIFPDGRRLKTCYNGHWWRL